MSETNLMSGEKSGIQKMIERLCTNREWLDQHIDELTDQYRAGDWIAILDRKVMAKGSDPQAVRAALGENFADEIIILCVPDKEISQPI